MLPNYYNFKVLKVNVLAVCFLVFLSAFITGNVYAERFFKKHSTWYEKIPENPILNPDSQNYVDRMDFIRHSPAYNYRGWSIPVYYADENDPLVTVNVRGCYDDPISIGCERITFHGWNLNVPWPAEVSGASEFDSHVLIIGPNRQYAWDLYRYHITTNDTKLIKRHDLSGDGVYQPWPGNGSPTYIEHPFHGNARAAPVPLIHTLVLYDDVKSGYIDHALAFGYGGETGKQFLLPKPPSVYPCNTMKDNYGWADHEWTPLLGHRFQLDPTLDVDDPADWGGNALSAGEKVIVRALQEYGMIYVENSGPNNFNILLENLEFDAGRSWSDPEVTIFGAGKIFTKDLRLIEPLITGPKPEITSPTPGSQICNTSEQFCWNEGADTIYWLGVGTSQANVDGTTSYGDIFAGSLTGGCQTVNNIPSAGTLYVRLWYKEGSGSWQYIDYNYTLDCGGGTPEIGTPEITIPTPGSTLISSTVTFQWSAGSGVDQYWLGVGTSQASVSNSPWGDILAGTTGLNTSQQLTGIPLDGNTVYVRLWWLIGTTWSFTDYIYQTQGGI